MTQTDTVRMPGTQTMTAWLRSGKYKSTVAHHISILVKPLFCQAFNLLVQSSVNPTLWNNVKLRTIPNLF
jgi:hypothetical protein